MKAITYFLLLFGFAACNKKQVEEEPSGPPLQAVRIATVETRDISSGHDFLADVVPEKSIRIIAQVPGTLTSLPIPEGDIVKSGTILAKISAPDISVRVSRVRSERKRAERERDFACKTLSTDVSLASSGDLSNFKLERSKKNCDSATLAAHTAKLAEKEAGVAKSRAKEIAPFEGRVLKHLIDPGQSVGPGTPIILFSSFNQQLRIRIPESDLTGVRIGNEVTSIYGKGKVVKIGAQAMGPGRLIELRVELDLKDPSILRPGNSVKVSLLTNSIENASTIPSGALGEDQEGAFILVVEEGKAKRVKVEPGLRSHGRVSISPPLKEGTRVVTGSLSKVRLNTPLFEVAQ